MLLILVRSTIRATRNFSWSVEENTQQRLHRMWISLEIVVWTILEKKKLIKNKRKTIVPKQCFLYYFKCSVAILLLFRKNISLKKIIKNQRRNQIFNSSGFLWIIWVQKTHNNGFCILKFFLNTFGWVQPPDIWCRGNLFKKKLLHLNSISFALNSDRIVNFFVGLQRSWGEKIECISWILKAILASPLLLIFRSVIICLCMHHVAEIEYV